MPGINANRSCLIVVLVCAFNSGCISVSPAVYEESWARQMKLPSGACPDIHGEYRNSGEAYSRVNDGTLESQERSLAAFFHVTLHVALEGGTLEEIADPELADRRYQTVRLQLAEDTLRVEATLADGKVSAFDLPIRKQCRDSTLLLTTTRGHSIDPVVSEFGYYVTALGRTADGSLLVRQSRTEAGLFWLIPIGASTSAEWMMFRPAMPAPTPQ